MHSKRATWQWRLARVAVAIVTLVALNFAAYSAWNHYFPNNPLFPESQVGEDDQRDKPIPVANSVVIAQNPKNAEELIDSLLRVAPTPGTEWQIIQNDPQNLSNIADSTCQTPPLLFPGLQGQQSWRPTSSSTSSASPSPSPTSEPSEEPSESFRGLGKMSYNDALTGLVQQVSIYPAGTGASVFADLKERLSNCYYGENWSLSYSTPLYLGQESLYATFSSPEGGDQELVVFRYGDVLGTISDRNYGSAQSMASQWAMLWAPILQGLCRDTGSTIEDATRQPLLADTYRPYFDKRPIRLSEPERFGIEQEEETLARQRALQAASPEATGTQNRVYDIPESYTSPATAPMLQPGESVTLNSPPESSYGLSVVIPDEPVEPTLPNFPEVVREVRNVEGPVADKSGPGCGWALLGQSPPAFDEEASKAIWEEEAEKVRGELAEDYRRWVRETWDYAISYKKYLREAQIWNAWATLATLRVAEVDWRHYDALLQQYESDVIKYQSEMETVLECEAELADAIREREELENPNEGTETSPSPAPTSSLPPLPVCDERPIKPVPPSPPLADRPPNMLS